MGRRSHQATPAQTAQTILLFLIALAGPFIILGYWLYQEALARSTGQTAPAPQVDQEKMGHMQQIEALLAEGDEAGFERRSDDLFDARSREARALNREVEGHLEALAAIEEQELVSTTQMAKLDSARLAAATLVLVFGFLYFRQAELGWFLQSLVASLAALILGFGRYFLTRR